MTETAAESKVFLPGLALAGYRSFGPNIQFMGPFAQINVFAGPNNVGKSNILRFIHQLLPHRVFKRGKEFEFNDERDVFTKLPSRLIVGLPLPTTSEELRSALPDVSQAQLETAIWLLESQVATHGTSQPWWFQHLEVKKSVPLPNQDFFQLPEFASSFKKIDITQSPIWRAGSQTWESRHNKVRVNNIKELVRAVFDDLWPYTTKVLPEVRYVPATRQIRNQANRNTNTIQGYASDGENLAKVYESIERAGGLKRRVGQEQVHKILKFLRNVTGESDISLTVPFEADYFEVLRNDNPESLDVLGSGIGQLIMMAIEVTLRENQIICIEEPELFLHPVLQRKLIEYLKKTTNQYLISTHSAQFLDVPEIAVFHLEMTPEGTRVRKADTSSARFGICRDLGYRASDIVQANCVVWVEGPSELIYLRKWIGEIDSDLREGIEYSVMFYGGGLRSWLTGDDPEEAQELISLVAINRHCAFVMDSDKSRADVPLQTNKDRVRESIEGHGLVWIRQGREIENYIPYDQRLRCVTAVRKSVASEVQDAWPYGHALPEESGKGSKVDKVKFAKAVVGEPVQWGDTDLKVRVFKLVNYIRTANHQAELPVPPDLQAQLLPGEAQAPA